MSIFSFFKRKKKPEAAPQTSDQQQVSDLQSVTAPVPDTPAGAEPSPARLKDAVAGIVASDRAAITAEDDAGAAPADNPEAALKQPADSLKVPDPEAQATPAGTADTAAEVIPAEDERAVAEEPKAPAEVAPEAALKQPLDSLEVSGPEAQAAPAGTADAAAEVTPAADEIEAKEAPATATVPVAVKVEAAAGQPSDSPKVPEPEAEPTVAVTAAAVAEVTPAADEIEAKEAPAAAPAPVAAEVEAAAGQPSDRQKVPEPEESAAPVKRRGRRRKAAAEPAAEQVAEKVAEQVKAGAEAESPVAEKPSGGAAEVATAAAAAGAAASAVQEKPVRKNSFFARLRKTRDQLASGFGALISGRKIDEDLYEELETVLLTSDLGVNTTETVIERLRNETKLYQLRDAAALRRNLTDILTGIVEPCAVPLVIPETPRPFVILMVGVNGAGKTTTIAKLTRKYREQGLKVMLAAGDTFRAAAVEQLKTWGEREGVPVIAQDTGSDSASVLFDALNAARSRGSDVLICDTAGRLQNKENLMDELRKLVRVMKKIDPEAPHEVLMVLDATTGQNAISQVKLFSQAVPVTGLIVSKLDGTARGGVIFSLAHEFRLPIRYIGLGEKAEDLREFEARNFVQSLVEA